MSSDEKPKAGVGGWVKFAAALGVLLLTAGAPLLIAVVIVGVLIAERRLVRQRWWWAWTVAAFAAALLAAGGLWPWLTGGWRAIAAWGARLGIPADWLRTIHLPAEWLRTPWSWPQIIWHEVLVAAPIGILIVALFNLSRLDSRRQMGRIDSDEYSNLRPVGWIDRRRCRKNLAAAAAGRLGTPPGRKGDAMFPVAAGRYGHPVAVDRATLKKPVLVLGGPRSGKTRLASSLASQEIRTGGGGLIAIDYKAEPAFVAAYAELAHQLGRTFLHFQLNEKSHNNYQRPHPYAPPTPAFYDPLSHGNGSSKAEMLTGSAPRGGDAAVYLRTAQEVVQIAYDVAKLTGLDRRWGGFDVIERMLHMEQLSAAAERITARAVQQQYPSMSDGQAADWVRRIQVRVAQFSETYRGDQALRGAVGDTRSWVSKFASSPAIGGRMRPAPPEQSIDLVRAILRDEIVVFSLPVQDYPAEAAAIGNMVLLDLANATSTLRGHKQLVGQLTGETATAPDATPWRPLVVQIEEFGSANNEVVLQVLNKSSAEGIRPILSTQSWADLQAVDNTGVWARRLLDQVGNLFTFNLVDPEGDKLVADVSGKVHKQRPQEAIAVRKANIIGIGRSARRAADTRTAVTEEPRIPYGQVQALRLPPAFEMLWIAKTPHLVATHTMKEGPNRWFETLTFTGVQEVPWGFNPWTESEAWVQAALEAGRSAAAATAAAVRDDPIVAAVVNSADRDAGLSTVTEHQQQHNYAKSAPPVGSPTLSDGGYTMELFPPDTPQQLVDQPWPRTEASTGHPAAYPTVALTKPSRRSNPTVQTNPRQQHPTWDDAPSDSTPERDDAGQYPRPATPPPPDPAGPANPVTPAGRDRSRRAAPRTPGIRNADRRRTPKPGNNPAQTPPESTAQDVPPRRTSSISDYDEQRYPWES